MWLLALAVPVQGFAAASMLRCGPGHHDTVSGHSHADADHDHDGHPHDDAMGAVPDEAQDEAHAHADDIGGDVVSSDQDAAPAHGLDKAKTGSCSACASCCTATALLSKALTFEASPAPESFQPLAPRSVATFLTEGPERPPRSILA